jgi:hypothetical protein
MLFLQTASSIGLSGISLAASGMSKFSSVSLHTQYFYTFQNHHNLLPALLSCSEDCGQYVQGVRINAEICRRRLLELMIYYQTIAGRRLGEDHPQLTTYLCIDSRYYYIGSRNWDSFCQKQKYDMI